MWQCETCTELNSDDMEICHGCGAPAKVKEEPVEGPNKCQKCGAPCKGTYCLKCSAEILRSGEQSPPQSATQKVDVARIIEESTSAAGRPQVKSAPAYTPPKTPLPPKRSHIFTNIAIVIGVIGIICGVVLGVTIPYTEVLPYTGTVLTSFNFGLMIGSWLSFALLAIGFFALGCLLANQEAILRKLDEN